MVQFAGNYTKDKRFAKTNWLCKCKASTESESHLIGGKCEVYSKIRNKYGKLTNEDDLA